jgi:hypothetical protein
MEPLPRRHALVRHRGLASGPRTGDLFTAGGEFQVPWRQPVDVDGVADRVASVSFIAALPDDERDRVLDRIRAVASEMEGPLALEYVADVFVFDRVR